MAVIPSTIDIVVADMKAALTFYRTLGLAALSDHDDEPQANVYTPGGATLGFLTEALMRRADPQWVTPVGQRVTFACRCDSPEEVDRTYARMTGAGYVGLKIALGYALGPALRLCAGPGRQPCRPLCSDDAGG